MYRTIQDALDDWQYEHEATVKVFRGLTDASIGQRVSPEGRRLGTIAWHIVVSLGEMINRTGLRLEGPGEDAPEPLSATAIADAYARSGESLTQQIQKSWKDADLDQKSRCTAANSGRNGLSFRRSSGTRSIIELR